MVTSSIPSLILLRVYSSFISNMIYSVVLRSKSCYKVNRLLWRIKALASIIILNLPILIISSYSSSYSSSSSSGFYWWAILDSYLCTVTIVLFVMLCLFWFSHSGFTSISYVLFSPRLGKSSSNIFLFITIMIFINNIHLSYYIYNMTLNITYNI